MNYTQAIAAIRAAGYDASPSSTPETIYVAVSDDDGDAALATLRSALPGASTGRAEP
jgi:hypothetical protein